MEMDEMSFGRKFAIRELQNLQFTIVIHLVLLFSFPKSENSKGWLVELNGWRRKLVQKNRGRKGTKNYKFADLLKALWEQPLGEETDRSGVISDIENDKGILVVSLEPRIAEFKDFVLKYITSIQSNIDFKL